MGVMRDTYQGHVQVSGKWLWGNGETRREEWGDGESVKDDDDDGLGHDVGD